MRTLSLALIIGLSLLSLPASAMEEGKANLFTLSYEQAEKAVGFALADLGVAEKVAATINGRMGKTLYAHSSPLTVEIRGVQFDKASSRWSANLLMMAGKDVVTAMPVDGRFDILAEIPVLKRTVRNGELIDATYIELQDIAAAKIRTDTVTDIASLIGKSPAHTISAGRPIRIHEIEVPPMVRRNNVVRIRYSSPGIEISTTGQAMEDGHKGNVIKVKNLTSKKIVQAVVDDVASVSVIAPGSTHAENNAVSGEPYVTN